MLEIEDRQVERALIIDDDPDARRSYEYVIEDIGIQPVPLEGPLQDMSDLLARIQPADVVLCDFHLKKHNYANWDGDMLVAECYKEKIPGVLCTSYPDAMFRRDIMKYIPRLIKSGDPQPVDLLDGWKQCLNEWNGEFASSRKAWRTLVRVEEVDREQGMVYVIVPSWSVHEKVLIDIDSVPRSMRNYLETDHRFHAHVNTGALSHEDLFFEKWEVD